MRILQICSARSIGGGERYLADLSNALALRGHDIFFAIPPGAPLKDELHKIQIENIKFSPMRNAIDIVSAFQLAKIARETAADIIHAHLARDYPLAAAAARFSNTPFVLTRHVLFPLKKMQKLLLKRVSGIIAPSNAIADALKKQNIFPPEKITTIRYGIDLEHFLPVKKEINLHFTVGTIGHLAPIKGHDTFIRAARIVLQKRPDIRFIIVGEDKSADGKNRLEIEELLAELNLQNKIEMAGWTDDIRPFLQKFDLFVSAARAEAFGLVMVEAMMAEIPLIATKSEGAQEIIEDGKSGVLVEIEDHEKMAEAILDLAENQEKREKLSMNGRRRVEEHFSLERMVEKTEEFYRKILAG